ncbi:MAG TPA: GNAT family N-acetyltransferase, partial [bacterium]|nr:GNAT family N-acetyltransferase [bacterium]
MDLQLLRCPCGQDFPGEDRDQLYSAIRAHADAVHPDLGLSDLNIRDFIEASFRLSPVRPRLEVLPPLTIKRLTPELASDFFHFFDHEAFAGNPAWAGCYCVFPLFGGTPEEWGCRGAQQNRAEMAEYIATGQVDGYLAYAGEQVAGWCHAGPRRRLRSLDYYPGHESPDPDHSGATACFIVAPPYRRHGIAEALLDAALEGFRAQGFRWAEGYPRKQEGL